MEKPMAVKGETRLVIPALGPVYRCLGQFADPLLRVTFALLVFPSGHAKLTNPRFAAEVTDLIARLGFPWPGAWFLFIALLETVGVAALAAGLFTRLLGAIFTIEMLIVAIGVHWPEGRGYQYPFLLAAVAFALALRGGGRWSLDRLIGREF
jgi:putative oxidoreductase